MIVQTCSTLRSEFAFLLISLRLRDGKLEQGVLREAASRLQQKIQKHLLDSEDLKEQALDEEKSQKLLHEVDSKEELVLPKEMKSGVLGKGDSCIDLGQGGEPEKQVNGQYQIVFLKSVHHSRSTFD